jgi:transposase
VELYLKVRLAVSEGMSRRQAAKHFNISRDSVAKMLSYSTPPGYQRRSPIRRPKLDAFVSTIDHWLDEDLTVPRKQRHTAKRVFDRLRDECGFTGGYTIIKDYMREREQRCQEMFVPLSHPPGHAQADFGEAMVVIGGVEQKARFFVLDLPHSDACYVRAYPAAVAEAWVDGHIHAFAFFGAVPQSIVYDNDRCLVAKILPDGTRKRAALFSGFLSHYLIRDRYGRPARATTRGMSRASLAMPVATSWCRSHGSRHGMRSTLWLEEQCRKRQHDRLRGESETIGERLQRDLAAMRHCRLRRSMPATRPAPGDGAIPGALQDQRLLRSGRLWPSGGLGPGLCRRGGDRLPRRDHRPSSPELGTGRRRLRSHPLPAADRAEDQCIGSGRASAGLGPARRVRHAAPPDGRHAWPSMGRREYVQVLRFWKASTSPICMQR